MLDMEKVAARLKQLRLDNGLTQDNVAESVYVSRQAVSSWELGTALPSIPSCILLLELYHTTLDDLLCLNETASRMPPDGRRQRLLYEILNGTIRDFSEQFYMFAPTERRQILEKIAAGEITVSIEELLPYCSKAEKQFLLGRDEDEY